MPKSDVLGKQLESVLRKLESKRQAHLDAIVEIDELFAQHGMKPSSGSSAKRLPRKKKRKTSKRRKAGKAKKTGKRKKTSKKKSSRRTRKKPGRKTKARTRFRSRGRFD